MHRMSDALDDWPEAASASPAITSSKRRSRTPLAMDCQR